MNRARTRNHPSTMRIPNPGQAARRQRGSTFLGLIIGAVIGLAVALAVAIYVTKVPVPFVNKGGSRTTTQDAAEAEKNRDWDPNAQLRGREDAKPAATDGATANGETASPPLEAASAGARPVPAPAEVQRGQSPAADPLGELAATRSGTADPFAYFVQAGAFRTPEDADAQRARLLLMGIQAKVSEREQAGRMVYRVRVGPLENRDAADRVKARLDENGFDAALVRVQR